MMRLINNNGEFTRFLLLLLLLVVNGFKQTDELKKAVLNVV